VVCSRETRDIGNIFAKRLLTVHMQPGQRFVLVELVHQSLTGSFEVSRVLRRPPVGELAFGVKFRTGIVEAMADLVPDGGADRTIVGSRIGLGIEEGRL